MAILGEPDVGLDGVVELQLVIEETPVIVQVPIPVGVAPLVGPLTVAVKTIVLPIFANPEFGLTVTLGVPLPTTASVLPLVKALAVT